MLQLGTKRILIQTRIVYVCKKKYIIRPNLIKDLKITIPYKGWNRKFLQCEQTDHCTHLRSQMMQVPSELALMHISSFLRTLMQDTEPLCSFIASTRLCDVAVTFHTRTWPSPPPLMIRLQSDVVAMAVTPLLWASLIMYISLPDSG